MVQRPDPATATGPSLGDVVVSVPRGVAGPALDKRASAPRGTSFAVFSFKHSAWLTDVVGLQLRVGVEDPFPRSPEVILTRLSRNGVPIGELAGKVAPDDGVNELYTVVGFTLDDNAVLFQSREVHGVLRQVCTCPAATDGRVMHRNDCPVRTVTSGGN